MTPQEQIEELKKAVNKLAALSVYLCEEVYDEPDGEKITDAVARFEDLRDLVLRSIRFDSPQISEGEVTVTLSREEIEAIFEAMSPGYSHEGPMDQHLKAVYPKLRETRACLSAALTQKGDNE